MDREMDYGFGMININKNDPNLPYKKSTGKGTGSFIVSACIRYDGERMMFFMSFFFFFIFKYINKYIHTFNENVKNDGWICNGNGLA